MVDTNTSSGKDSIITTHISTVHKIYNKLRTSIKATSRELSHSNFQAYLIVCMREVSKRKYHLTGLEKKIIVIEILSLLLSELGLPQVAAHYTAGVIAGQVEQAYTIGMHKYKRKKQRGGCLVM